MYFISTLIRAMTIMLLHNISTRVFTKGKQGATWYCKKVVAKLV